MDKWSKKFSKVLTAAGISMIVAVSSLAMPIAASAARTVTDDVMIRNDASTDAGIIGSLNEGDEVTILDVLQSADGYAWYYIQLENGATGYVRSDLIEADDSELANFLDNTQGQEQAQETTDQQETEEEAQEEPAVEEAAPEAQADPAQEQTAEAVSPDKTAEGYDATKDPSAGFRVGYEQEADGTVTWYVYNDDNGSKVKISDLQSQESTAKSSSNNPGMWRTLAIVFAIFTIGLAVLLFFLLKSIRDDRSKTRRRKANLEEKAADTDEDYEEEEEEFIFEDDEYEDEDNDGEKGEESKDDQPQENGTDEDKSTEITQEEADPSKKNVKSVKNTDSTITMEVPQEVKPTEIPADVIEAAIAAKTAQIEKNISKEGEAAKSDVAAPAAKEGAAQDDAVPAADQSRAQDNDAVQSKESPSSEDDSDQVNVYVEEKEEYIEEDEDYAEDEDYEEEDDEYESGTAKQGSAKGGFFGFLRKIFSADSKEDIEEDEDFDDYEEEPEEHEFDEFKEYPEDADLLPREDADDSDYIEDEEEFVEEESKKENKERGRLSMQRVMKNVSYKEEEADFSRSQEDDQEDFLYDDDDDMEYSFIGNRKK